MKIYLTTDTHFNHKKLIEYGRPEDFEERIWKGLKVINENDMLIHLGDVCIGDDEMINRRFTMNNGAKKVLVLGNHDHKSVKWYLEHGWDMVCERFDLKMYGKRIAFTHMPIAWDGYFDINIHGHFHNTDSRRYEEEFKKIMSGYNKLLALEYTDYKPVNLEKFN